MRLLILLLFIFTSGVVFSQSYPGSNEVKKPKDVTSKAVVLYSNDFSSPSDWSVTNNSSNNANWQITTNLNAAPIPFFHPAGFATATNGYAIIDSDAQGGTATQDCIIHLDSAISSCSSEPFVILRFFQMLRRFNDTTSVEVSNDGVNWTQFLCNPNLGNNDNTANPQKVDINISSVAGNQDTVYIRFRYRASDAWFWAIDDVQLLKQDQYDLEGMDVSFGSYGNWGLRLPYYQIPVEQIAPIEITGRVKNAGYDVQSDIFITSTATGGFSGTSAVGLLGANQTGTFDIQSLWSPSPSIGTKTITTTVSSSAVDQDPSNDTLQSAALEISSKFYARSTDVRTGRVSNNFYQFGYETGNIFDIFSDATVTSAMVHVAAESTPGAPLFAHLYEAIDSVTFNLLSVSDTVFLPSLATDQVFRVRLISPTLLEAGKSYLLTAGSTGSPTFPGLVMGTSNKAEIFTTFFLAENSTTWYSFTETPMVKMNFESVVEVSEENLTNVNFKVYPNPSNGMFTLSIPVDFELENVTVYTVDGQHIETFSPVITDHKAFVNLHHVPKGSYLIRLKTQNGIYFKRIILTK